MGICCRQKRRFKATTNSRHTLPVADNLLKQDFHATSPGQVWLSDITYIPTDEGWLYLAAHKDMCSKKIVGYAMGPRITRNLVMESLFRARLTTKPKDRTSSPLESRQPVLLPGIRQPSRTIRDAAFHERKGQLLRQCPHGKLLGAP